MADLNLVTQLRTTLARLETALGAIEEGLAYTDLDGIVEWTNSSFDRFVGRSRLQCLGTSLSQLLPQRYQAGRSEPTECLLFWARNGTGKVTWELTPTRPRRVIEVSWATVNVPNKQSLVFTFRDQSAIVQAQDKLIEARDQLEMQVAQRTHQLLLARDEAQAASQSKTRFLSSMSHEIRTPLNAVIGMTELLIDSPLSENQREMVETIHDSGEHLLGLINDILDLSQIESGLLKLNPRGFDLHSLLDDCMKLFQHQAATRNIRLEHSVPPETPRWIVGDDLKLRQMLFNLLGNACKYTNQGTICLSIEVAPAVHKEQELLFRVTDTGIGIPPDVLPSIFEEFTRHSNPAQTSQSAGLGLAICFRLCKLMGGQISVESILGEGSCFTLKLPFALTVEPQRDDDMAQSRGEFGHEIGILVADDNRVNQRVLQLMLAKLELKAELVGDGQAAVDRIGAGGIDLVFMDIEMPKLDGMAATRRLRSQGYSEIYVIALTAYSFNSHRQDCQAAGMNDFLSKPLRHDDLCAALSRFREWRRDRAAGELT